MLRCLGCGGKESVEEADDEDDDDGKEADDESSKPTTTPSTTEPPQPPAQAAAAAEAGGDDDDDDHPKKAVTPSTVRDEDRKMRNTLGLRVDPSVETELEELGMDPAVLLEPLTPRSLMTATPYPGKRSSVVLAAWGNADSLDADSPPDGALARDALPSLAPREADGTMEPPATPVGRDELALRRHRFFADLLNAAQAAAEHRVRFDPMGPVVAEGEPPAVQTRIEEVLTRLEDVTQRLEQSVRVVESAAVSRPPAPAPPPAPQEVPEESHSPPRPRPSQRVSFDLPSNTMSIQVFQDIIAGPLAQYLSISSQIGGDVLEQANYVKDSFQVQLKFLELAGSRPKPSNQNEIVTLLQPTSNKIVLIQEYREKKRASPQFNHLSTISESIPALGWVAVSPAPAPFVKEMKDAGMFYANRVLKDFKDRDRRHVDWVNAWVQTLVELQDFVKKHHTTGLEWQPMRAGGAPPPPPPAAMPPPPPVLPEGDLSNLSLDPTKDRSALFAEINQGENITRNLKKVSSDMQTHKNPALRSGPAPFKTAEGSKSSGLAAPAADKPPKFTRDGKKWLIEFQKGNKNLVVEGAEMNNVVYMYKCVDSTLIVKGKINSIVMDSCKKSAVVFDSLVSSIEFVNCQSVQMQVTGIVPTITIDKSDGCQMYLSEQSLNVEIVSSKSSEMNVLIPSASGDYVEHAIPEQYRTKVSKNGLTTTVVESLG